jgi:hypothetical protein
MLSFQQILKLVLILLELHFAGVVGLVYGGTLETLSKALKLS